MSSITQQNTMKLLQSGKCCWQVAIQMDVSYSSVQLVACLLVPACPGSLVGAQMPS